MPYAWSPIVVTGEKDDQGNATRETIPVGESVSQSDLGVSDAEWQNLLDSGVVREEEYPTDEDGNPVAGPPKEEMLRQAKERYEAAVEGAMKQAEEKKPEAKAPAAKKESGTADASK